MLILRRCEKIRRRGGKSWRNVHYGITHCVMDKKTDRLPLRGEVWMVDLNPAQGHEQGGSRPGLVVSVDFFNQGPADMVILLPVTSKEKRVISHVGIVPPEGGLRQKSFIKCEDIRALSLQRLSRKIASRDISYLRSSMKSKCG